MNMQTIIESRHILVAAACPLPPFSGTRVLLMPIVLGERRTVPETIAAWFPLLDLCAREAPQYRGLVCYVTIDERVVQSGETHRRPRLHVDGYWRTEDRSGGGSWGGGGGGWGGTGPEPPYPAPSPTPTPRPKKKAPPDTQWQEGTGLFTTSSHAGCRAFNQVFVGEPEPEGDCEHLRDQGRPGEVLAPGALYWLSPASVHESICVEKTVARQFFRLSLPSGGDWYDGCTPNPLGVRPTGKIQPRRRFMDWVP